MQGKTQNGKWPSHDGFSPPPRLDEVCQFDHRRSSSHSEDAMAHIQNILEQDDAETSLSSSHGFTAYQTKAFELAAILKEDSFALPLDWAVTPTQSPFHAEPPQNVELGSRLILSSIAHLPSRVRFLNSLSSSQDALDAMPSKVLDLGLSSSLLSTPPTACKREKTGVSPVPMHPQGVIKHVDAQKTVGTLKLRKDRSFSKHRVCQSGSMSISKQVKCYAEYIDMSIHMERPLTHIQSHDLLLQCAEAVGLNDTGKAMAIVCRIKQQTSPYGSAAERLAYYFVKALYARFEGKGWSLYTAHLSQPHPSSRQILEASMKYASSCPFAKVSRFLANQTVLKVVKGASSLHIIEYRMSGLHYPSLFKELAALPGGPPKVYLVAIVVPQYSLPSCERDVICSNLEETGRRLSKCAESFKVSFQFTFWVGERENIRLQDFVASKRSPDEVLVVISACFLRFVMDNIWDPRSLRIKLLKMLYDFNPDVYIQGVVSGAYSNPFYSQRFKEALCHFSCIYDVLDTFIGRNDQNRIVLESEVLGKAIMNIVACEGPLVSGRVEKYKEWQANIEDAGMQQLPIDKHMISKVQGMLQSWHKDYIVTEDRQFLLMGWKGRTVYAWSAWKSPIRPG